MRKSAVVRLIAYRTTRRLGGAAALLLATAFGAAASATAEEVRAGVLRTPDQRFENLPGFAFPPHYREVMGYRVHYLDEDPRDGASCCFAASRPGPISIARWCRSWPRPAIG